MYRACRECATSKDPPSLDTIRAEVAREVDARGMSDVAREMWLGTGPLQVFLRAGRSQPRTVTRLDQWYRARRNAADGDAL